MLYNMSSYHMIYDATLFGILFGVPNIFVLQNIFG